MHESRTPGSLEERATIISPEFSAMAREKRGAMARQIDAALGPFDRAHLAALVDAARERFVRPQDLARSIEDVPLVLDDRGDATISAPHAYLLSFRVLGLKAGDAFVELGSGSGYGAALAAHVVGETGRVDTFEVDEELSNRATELLAHHANVRVRWLDAHGSESFWGGATRVSVTFAVTNVPQAWLAALGEGGVLVAPVGPPNGEQRLVMFTKRHGEIHREEKGAVRYVPDRSPI